MLTMRPGYWLSRNAAHCLGVPDAIGGLVQRLPSEHCADLHLTVSRCDQSSQVGAADLVSGLPMVVSRGETEYHANGYRDYAARQRAKACGLYPIIRRHEA